MTFTAEALAAIEHLAKLEELLVRIVKYAKEDRAVTPGSTRLARALDEATALIALHERAGK